MCSSGCWLWVSWFVFVLFLKRLVDKQFINDHSSFVHFKAKSTTQFHGWNRTFSASTVSALLYRHLSAGTYQHLTPSCRQPRSSFFFSFLKNRHFWRSLIPECDMRFSHVFVLRNFQCGPKGRFDEHLQPTLIFPCFLWEYVEITVSLRCYVISFIFWSL